MLLVLLAIGVAVIVFKPRSRNAGGRSNAHANGDKGAAADYGQASVTKSSVHSMAPEPLPANVGPRAIIIDNPNYEQAMEGYIDDFETF